MAFSCKVATKERVAVVFPTPDCVPAITKACLSFKRRPPSDVSFFQNLARGHAGFLKGGHFMINLNGGVQDLDGQTSSASLSQPHIQIKNSAALIPLNHRVMPALKRAMAPKYIILHMRMQFKRHQGAG